MEIRNEPIVLQVFDVLRNTKAELSKLSEEGKGLNPHFIGQHKGDTKEPFVVITEGSQIPTLGTNRTGQQLIDIIVMVPLTSYVQMNYYIKDVKKALKGLSFLERTGNETPAIVDNDNQAYTASIEYRLMKDLSI